MSEAIICGTDRCRWPEAEPHDMSHYDDLVGLPFPPAPTGASIEYMQAQSELSALFRKLQNIPIDPNVRYDILNKIQSMGLKEVGIDISKLQAGNKWLSEIINLQ